MVKSTFFEKNTHTHTHPLPLSLPPFKGLADPFTVINLVYLLPVKVMSPEDERISIEEEGRGGGG